MKLRKFFVGFFACLALLGWVGVSDAVLKGSGGASVVTAAAFPLLAPDGTCAAPSYAFSTASNLGFYNTGGPAGAACASSAVIFTWDATSFSVGGSGDARFVRDAANTPALKNGTAAQALRIYGTTTGPKYLTVTHDGTNAAIDTAASSGNLTIAGANATSVLFGNSGRVAGMQVRTAQQTAPTCTTNCGTPGNVCVGSDTAMICTMGTTPASGVLITFSGTWGAAPACTVQMALAGMVVGKQVLTAATSTTTITLVTNGTAPVAGDKYAIICVGVA